MTDLDNRSDLAPELQGCIGGELLADPTAPGIARREVDRLLTWVDGPAALRDRVLLALTEAVSNVAQHAYAEPGAGTVTYAADVEDGTVEVVVSDAGGGLRQRSRTAGNGFGLQVIAQCADDFAITDLEPGLEIWMSFVLPDA